ncbi:MAG TPA: hypothetical protein VEK07_14170 [Polyangiaceae bacterium]|nr:hypothetical protein [Polyangiaceae bacterium]
MTRRPIRLVPLAIGVSAALGAQTVLAQEAAPPALPPLPPVAAPPPPPPQPNRAERTPAPSTAEVRFESSEPGLQVFAPSSAAPVPQLVGYPSGGWYGQAAFAPLYSRVCSAPCTAQLPVGVHRLAVAKAGSPPVAASEAISIDGPAVVHADYVDRTGLRAAGWIIGLGGTIGGVVMISVATVDQHTACYADGFCYSYGRGEGGLVAGGIALIVGSAIAGSILATRRDEAHLVVTPLSLSPVGTARESPGDRGGAAAGATGPSSAPSGRFASAQGAAVGLQF